jgi:membrane protease subunit HflK
VRAVGLLVALLAAVGAYAWFAAFVQIGADEEAVVLRLGRYDRSMRPGPNFHFPPLETYERRSVTQNIDVEFGFRTLPGSDPPEYSQRPAEKTMVTADENLVDVNFAVRYKIENLRDYLFNLREPETAIRDVAAASIRSVVAQYPIEQVLAEGKARLQAEALDRIRVRLDDYSAGIDVINVQLQDVEPPDAVKGAFAEVTSAEQEGARLVLEARGYAEKVLPEARGKAEQLLNEAGAYRESRILAAAGETDRFDSVYVEYRRAPEVTRQRLYIETLEKILPGMEKVVMQEGQSDKVLPYLPVLPRGRQQ